MSRKMPGSIHSAQYKLSQTKHFPSPQMFPQNTKTRRTGEHRQTKDADLWDFPKSEPANKTAAFSSTPALLSQSVHVNYKTKAENSAGVWDCLEGLFVISLVSEHGDCTAAEGHYSSLLDSKLFKLKENSTNNDQFSAGIGVHSGVYWEAGWSVSERFVLVCGKTFRSPVTLMPKHLLSYAAFNTSLLLTIKVQKCCFYFAVMP